MSVPEDPEVPEELQVLHVYPPAVLAGMAALGMPNSSLGAHLILQHTVCGRAFGFNSLCMEPTGPLGQERCGAGCVQGRHPVPFIPCLLSQLLPHAVPSPALSSSSTSAVS